MILFDVSFVILTWNSEKYISDCLNSIFISLKNSGITYEIYIVDNGSKDNTVCIVQNYRKKYTAIIKPIFLKENTGTTASRNMALRRATGTHICIMDSDVELFPGVIERLLENLEDNTAGLSVPMIHYSNGKFQKSTDFFPTLIRKCYRYFFLRRMEAMETNWELAASPVEVDYAISAMWVFRKHVLDEIGFLDENIFYAPEDVDFCIRIWKAGYRIIYDQSVQIVHHTQEISRGFKLNKAFFEHIKGLIYYFVKHRYFFVAPSFKIKQTENKARS